MFVKPAPHPDGPDGVMIIRDPLSKRVLPAAGAQVPDTQYWFRRLRDGDVVEATPPEADSPKKRGN